MPIHTLQDTCQYDCYLAPIDGGMGPLEVATDSLGMVESVADAIIGCRSFAVALAYVLSLPVHKYGVADRLESPLDWDRKSWSQLHTPHRIGPAVGPWGRGPCVLHADSHVPRRRHRGIEHRAVVRQVWHTTRSLARACQAWRALR